MIGFYISGVVLSLLFNSFVVVVLVTDKKTNHIGYLMLSLSIADILQSAIGYPLEISAQITNITINETVCTIAGFSITFLALVSISHFTGISLLCAVIIKNPMKTRNLKPSISLYIILPSWSYGLLWSVMPLLGWSRYQREQGSLHRCSVAFAESTTNTISYAYTLLVFCYVVPIVIIVVSSVITIKQLGKMTRMAARNDPEDAAVDIRRKQEFRLLIMAFVLISVFLITWSPYAACVFVMTIHGKVEGSLLTFSALFAKCSTLYNPVIYVIFMRDFRQKCINVFRCMKKGEERELSATTTLVNSHSHNMEGLERETRL